MTETTVVTCPGCQSHRVHRSRARNRVEELRKYFTTKRLHRCHACGWRGWADVAAALITSTPDEAEAAPLDVLLLDQPPQQRSERV